mgnify:CR=1 FL=1
MMEIPIDKILGIGPQAMEVFVECGFETYKHLRKIQPDQYGVVHLAINRCVVHRIQQGTQKIHMDIDYWKRLYKRCIHILDQCKYGRPGSPAIDPPACLMCPLSLDYLEEPVITRDGYTYSKKHLEYWLERNGGVEPTTGQPMLIGNYFPNLNMEGVVQDYLREEWMLNDNDNK